MDEWPDDWRSDLTRMPRGAADFRLLASEHGLRRAKHARPNWTMLGRLAGFIEIYFGSPRRVTRLVGHAKGKSAHCVVEPEMSSDTPTDEAQAWIGCFAMEVMRVRPRWTMAAARALANAQWFSRRNEPAELAARRWFGSRGWTAFEDSGFASDPASSGMRPTDSPGDPIF